MATATAPTTRGKDGGVIPVIDIDAHKKEISRMRAEQEANLEQRLKLCNPKFAAEIEAKKPVFRWRIEFKILEREKETPPADKYADTIVGDDNDAEFKFRSITKHANAIDERTAWSLVCDQMGEWPSPKIAKPKFTRLKQVKI